jgi:hypothetical protein
VSDPRADGRPVREALRLLVGLPGIVGVRRVRAKTIEQVVELESRYERGVVVPLKNLGVHVVLKRKVAVAVLKDGRFRPPPAPTVYLVEEAGREECPQEHCIVVEGMRYRVVGEEILPSREAYLERTVPLGDSFVIFPDRRSSQKTPSYFLVPPLGFPELEAVGEQLGIRGVVSISPSAQADSRLRKACGFAEDPSLATLLVAFDLEERSRVRP